jgi:hypothetical protein
VAVDVDRNACFVGEAFEVFGESCELIADVEFTIRTKAALTVKSS